MATTRKRTVKKAAARKGATKAAARGGGDVVAQLAAIEAGEGSGTVRLTSRRTLDVTHLDKVFFPKPGFTKGDVMRWYARVAPFLLPLVKDRPLVFKRFPNGVGGPSFFQQNAPDDLPEVVRVETIRSEAGEPQRRFVGGDLGTILYGVQGGNISIDPWHARVGSLDFADYLILDLDPGPSASFARVVDVALWVREILDEMRLHGAPKTSGSSGIHIYVPLPPKVTDETAREVAQQVAERVASAHPKEATVGRAVKGRGKGQVYVDFLQNIRAKTVAAAYAVRAKPEGTVSAPLRWDELTHDLDLRDFTVATMPARLDAVGDLWGPAMKRKNRLDGVLAALKRGTRRS